MSSDPFSIPALAWSRRQDARLAAPGKPAPMGTIVEPAEMIPFIIRLTRQAKEAGEAGFDPINLGSAALPGPEMGVPLGGIGSGSITRGWRGALRRWQMRPGFVQLGPVWADQFSLYVEREGHPAHMQVLAAERPPSGTLRGWDWIMNPGCATYQALFPRAWTTYDLPAPGVRLVCRQLSPVIAHNYRESSFPVSELRWRVENTGTCPAKIGLMFTFQNGTGADNDRAGGHSNHAFPLAGDQGWGVELRHVHRQRQAYPIGTAPAVKNIFADPLYFGIAARGGAGVQATYRGRFTTGGDGLSVWNDFARDGCLDNFGDERPSVSGEAIGAAVALTVTLAPGESRELAFSLAWAMPLVRSGFGTPYYRRYTLFYGKEPGVVRQLLQDALAQAPEWETAIAAWQQPVLDDASLPEWYRRTLFNELYYLVDGGTLWGYPADQQPSPEDMGRFAYLESHEYRMYNTYDVHFYASFALALNWPKIELALQRDLGAATLEEYPDYFQEMFRGQYVPRKLYGAVPHDLGTPDEDPWKRVNGYNLHDVNQWKDLNPKLVLQVYRDGVTIGDDAFLAELWPAVEAALERTLQFDRDGDGLIENDGFPDQTYDVWTVSGASAYTGGLWLAALSAAAAMAERLGKLEAAQRYRELYARGQAAYHKNLWNGLYYNYDSSPSRQHNSIMADQLAGQWYAHACGLPRLVEHQRARSALRTVYDFNVLRFGGGLAGAVNGMRPEGEVDESALQAREVWSGTTYAVAAAMLAEGLREEAFQTAYGVYKVTYEDKGYWFQTPEAWISSGDYRSNTYMRPLAIWAMQWALYPPRSKNVSS